MHHLAVVAENFKPEWNSTKKKIYHFHILRKKALFMQKFSDSNIALRDFAFVVHEYLRGV